MTEPTGLKLTLETIDYLSEPVPAYNAAIDGAKTRLELIAAIEPYAEFAHNALERVQKMNEYDFWTFRRCLKKERKGEYSGHENADLVSTIIMPEAMLKISFVADQFQVLWGTACIRLRDEGFIEKRDGHIVVNIGVS